MFRYGFVRWTYRPNTMYPRRNRIMPESVAPPAAVGYAFAVVAG
jgi:hypothetical protein